MPPNEKQVSTIHVVDQSGQPYGSVRRCCNWCGSMVVSGMIIMESMEEWWDLPPDQRCSVKKDQT